MCITSEMILNNEENAKKVEPRWKHRVSSTFGWHRRLGDNDLGKVTTWSKEEKTTAKASVVRAGEKKRGLIHRGRDLLHLRPSGHPPPSTSTWRFRGGIKPMKPTISADPAAGDSATPEIKTGERVCQRTLEGGKELFLVNPRPPRLFLPRSSSRREKRFIENHVPDESVDGPRAYGSKPHLFLSRLLL